VRECVKQNGRSTDEEVIESKEEKEKVRLAYSPLFFTAASLPPPIMISQFLCFLFAAVNQQIQSLAKAKLSQEFGPFFFSCFGVKTG